MKICPKCNNTHLNNGIFCSRSCANSRGPRSAETKLKIQKALRGHEMSVDTKDKISISLGGMGHRKIKKCVVCGNITNSIEKMTCSIACHEIKHRQGSSIGGKKSAANRIKRSKDEIYLYNLCLTQWPEAQHNLIICDGWDADIVLPKHKVLIFWNGPWHYREMNISNHSLKQVQNRDKIKQKIFENLNWKVFVFQDNKYTPQEAFEELVLVIRNDLISEGL